MQQRLLRLAVFMVVLGGASTAGAADGTKVPKMAVLEVKTAGKVEAKEVQALSALIAAEAGRYHAKVISGADLQTLLGFERQKQLMGCSDGSCLVEIGGALGVDYLLSTEVGQVGSRYLLNVTVLDVAKATALGRSSQAVPSLNALIDAVDGAIAEAFGGKLGAKKAKVGSPAPEGVEAKAPDAAVAAPAEAGTSGQRIAGYALLAGGAALLVGGGVSGVLAYTEYTAAMNAGAPTQAQYDATASSIKTKSAVADGLLAAGVVAAGVGLVVALTAPSAEPKAATVSFAPLSGGGAVLFAGEF